MSCTEQSFQTPPLCHGAHWDVELQLPTCNRAQSIAIKSNCWLISVFKKKKNYKGTVMEL